MQRSLACLFGERCVLDLCTTSTCGLSAALQCAYRPAAAVQGLLGALPAPLADTHKRLPLEAYRLAERQVCSLPLIVASAHAHTRSVAMPPGSPCRGYHDEARRGSAPLMRACPAWTNGLGPPVQACSCRCVPPAATAPDGLPGSTLPRSLSETRYANLVAMTVLALLCLPSWTRHAADARF